MKTRSFNGVAAVLAALLLTSAVASEAFAQDQFQEKHPRRAEVLGRDQALRNETNADKGHLHGHYHQIKREEASIDRQEQRDARRDGGHITKGEQRKLNREEGHVQHQINRDSQ